MENKRRKRIEVPLYKWFLTFRKECHLEEEYQENSREISYFEMRYLTLIFICFSLVYCVINIYLYLNTGQKGRSKDDSMDERRYFIMSITAPLNVLVFTYISLRLYIHSKY